MTYYLVDFHSTNQSNALFTKNERSQWGKKIIKKIKKPFFQCRNEKKKFFKIKEKFKMKTLSEAAAATNLFILNAIVWFEFQTFLLKWDFTFCFLDCYLWLFGVKYQTENHVHVPTEREREWVGGLVRKWKRGREREREREREGGGKNMKCAKFIAMIETEGKNNEREKNRVSFNEKIKSQQKRKNNDLFSTHLHFSYSFAKTHEIKKKPLVSIF